MTENVRVVKKEMCSEIWGCSMGYRIIDGKAYPVGNFGPISLEPRVLGESINKGESFKDVLKKAVEENNGYMLSKHAAERLSGSNFTSADMDVIGKGFKIAEDKGSKNSVIIYKDVALIASIENKTIITAVEKSRAKENIFTNIDSVLIL